MWQQSIWHRYTVTRMESKKLRVYSLINWQSFKWLQRCSVDCFDTGERKCALAYPHRFTHVISSHCMTRQHCPRLHKSGRPDSRRPNPVDSWTYELCDFSASRTHLIIWEVWSDKTSTVSLAAFPAVSSVILPASWLTSKLWYWYSNLSFAT